MLIHLVNPSDVSFGPAVITPRWLYVLAAATPDRYDAPAIIDETLEPFDPEGVRSGDVVGIGIHTANALRGYHVGRLAHARGAFVVFGGIHATLFPEEVRQHGAADVIVAGDGDIVWARDVDQIVTFLHVPICNTSNAARRDAAECRANSDSDH